MTDPCGWIRLGMEVIRSLSGQGNPARILTRTQCNHIKNCAYVNVIDVLSGFSRCLVRCFDLGIGDYRMAIDGGLRWNFSRINRCVQVGSASCSPGWCDTKVSPSALRRRNIKLPTCPLRPSVLRFNSAIRLSFLNNYRRCAEIFYDYKYG